MRRGGAARRSGRRRGRPGVAHLVGAVAQARERVPDLAADRGVGGRLGRHHPRHREAGLQLEEQPLRGAPPDAGDEHQRVDVLVDHDPAQRGRPVHRADRQRELGPDAGRADQHLEGVALLAGREPVEDQRGLRGRADA